MTTVERAEAREITAEIKAAVEAVLARRGMTLKVGTSHYGESYDVKLTAIKVDLDPETGVNRLDPRATDWARYARGFGLPASGLGKTFKASGKTFRVVGLAVSRRARPVCAVELVTGKEYIFPADSAKAFLAIAGVTE